MVFVEITLFIAFRYAHWSAEVAGTPEFSAAPPDAGDVIRGGAGLRKLRWLCKDGASVMPHASFTFRFVTCLRAHQAGAGRFKA